MFKLQVNEIINSSFQIIISIKVSNHGLLYQIVGLVLLRNILPYSLEASLVNLVYLLKHYFMCNFFFLSVGIQMYSNNFGHIKAIWQEVI